MEKFVVQQCKFSAIGLPLIKGGWGKSRNLGCDSPVEVTEIAVEICPRLSVKAKLEKITAECIVVPRAV
jgi:hypothetical protein